MDAAIKDGDADLYKDLKYLYYRAVRDVASDPSAALGDYGVGPCAGPPW